MMGKTHMSVALATYMFYQTPQSWQEFTEWGVGAGIVLLTSRLPDIDEPRSGMGSLVMPWVPSWLRAFAFLVVGGFLVYFGWNNQQWLIFSIGSMYLFFALIKHRESPSHGLVGLIFVLTIAYLINPAYLIPVIIGYGTHLFLDLITEGIALFWPLTARQRIPLMQTNCILERWVIYRGTQGYILWAVFQMIKPFFLSWEIF